MSRPHVTQLPCRQNGYRGTEFRKFFGHSSEKIKKQRCEGEDLNLHGSYPASTSIEFASKFPRNLAESPKPETAATGRLPQRPELPQLVAVHRVRDRYGRRLHASRRHLQVIPARAEQRRAGGDSFDFMTA